MLLQQESLLLLQLLAPELHLQPNLLRLKLLRQNHNQQNLQLSQQKLPKRRRSRHHDAQPGT
jgi:hypothetical protein